MDFRLWLSLAGIAGVLAAIVWWKRRARRVFTIDRVRVEMHEAHIVDDRVVDAVWRAAISMTNKTRRPRALPLLEERATVTARHRVYLAYLHLESDATEIDPDDMALAWVDFALPAGLLARSVTFVQLRADLTRARRVWLACQTARPLPLKQVV